jgi:hypothetical protein
MVMLPPIPILMLFDPEAASVSITELEALASLAFSVGSSFQAIVTGGAEGVAIGTMETDIEVMSLAWAKVVEARAKTAPMIETERIFNEIMM